jgi:hypothetical protein
MSTDALFDILFLLGPNDVSVIHDNILYAKKNVIGYRHIYIICFDDTLQFDGCITISEKLFPFTMETVAKYHGKLGRNGWYLQQLLKLYAGFVIPNILENYLVIDADVAFLKPTRFYEDGKYLYNYSDEYHPPYFAHMQTMHPSLIRVDPSKSGISHHMLFQTKYIKELFELVESAHNGEPFYNIFLKSVTDYYTSGASEYEIYFNFIQQRHPSDIQIRYLKYINTNDISKKHEDYDYLSFAHYMR